MKNLFGNTERVATFAMSNIFKGRRLSADSRHFLCLYIIATKILRLLPPCGEVNALPTAFEVCSTTGKDSRFSVYNAKTSNNMAELVIQSSNGNDVTTSLIVAQVFGKEHKNVLRDIESLSCSEDFNRLNFERITYKDARNREQTAYEMTKDGFSFLVMGYTGAKAGEFKERFINEFNRREALLKDDDYILMRSQQILQKRVENLQAENKRLEQQNALQEEQLRQSAPKVEYCDKVLSSKGYLTINMIAACLGISDIKLNKLLCQWGIQYKESGVYYLYSKYQDKGYTVHRPHAYTDSLGDIKTRQHMYWTEAGKKFIIELYNSKVAA